MSRRDQEETEEPSPSSRPPPGKKPRTHGWHNGDEGSASGSGPASVSGNAGGDLTAYASHAAPFLPQSQQTHDDCSTDDSPGGVAVAGDNIIGRLRNYGSLQPRPEHAFDDPMQSEGDPSTPTANSHNGSVLKSTSESLAYAEARPRDDCCAHEARCRHAQGDELGNTHDFSLLRTRHGGVLNVDGRGRGVGRGSTRREGSHPGRRQVLPKSDAGDGSRLARDGTVQEPVHMSPRVAGRSRTHAGASARDRSTLPTPPRAQPLSTVSREDTHGNMIGSVISSHPPAGLRGEVGNHAADAEPRSTGENGSAGREEKAKTINNEDVSGESDEEPECRVCRMGDEDGTRPLAHPCACRGSIKYVHQDCLVEWLQSRRQGRRAGGANRPGGAHHGQAGEGAGERGQRINPTAMGGKLQTQRCEVCKQKFVFKAKYRAGAPEQLGVLQFLKGAIRRAAPPLMDVLRGGLNFSMWGIGVPVMFCMIFRLGVGLALLLAQELSAFIGGGPLVMYPGTMAAMKAIAEGPGGASRRTSIPGLARLWCNGGKELLSDWCGGVTLMMGVMCLGPPCLEIAVEFVTFMKAFPLILEAWWTGEQEIFRPYLVGRRLIRQPMPNRQAGVAPVGGGAVGDIGNIVPEMPGEQRRLGAVGDGDMRGWQEGRRGGILGMLDRMEAILAGVLEQLAMPPREEDGEGEAFLLWEWPAIRMAGGCLFLVTLVMLVVQTIPFTTYHTAAAIYRPQLFANSSDPPGRPAAARRSPVLVKASIRGFQSTVAGAHHNESDVRHFKIAPSHVYPLGASDRTNGRGQSEYSTRDFRHPYAFEALISCKYGRDHPAGMGFDTSEFSLNVFVDPDIVGTATESEGSEDAADPFAATTKQACPPPALQAMYYVFDPFYTANVLDELDLLMGRKDVSKKYVAWWKAQLPLPGRSLIVPKARSLAKGNISTPLSALHFQHKHPAVKGPRRMVPFGSERWRVARIKTLAAAVWSRGDNRYHVDKTLDANKRRSKVRSTTPRNRKKRVTDGRKNPGERRWWQSTLVFLQGPVVPGTADIRAGELVVETLLGHLLLAIFVTTLCLTLSMARICRLTFRREVRRQSRQANARAARGSSGAGLREGPDDVQNVGDAHDVAGGQLLGGPIDREVQMGLDLKMATMAVLELFVLPLWVGCAIDLSSLPLLASTLERRLAFVSENPLSSFALHWGAGSMAISILGCLAREVGRALRPGLLPAWGEPPVEQGLEGALERMAQQPFLSQLAMYLVRAVSYPTAVSVMVWIPSQWGTILTALKPLATKVGWEKLITLLKVRPLLLGIGGPTEGDRLGMDLLLFHFILPVAMEHLKLKGPIRRIVCGVLRIACAVTGTKQALLHRQLAAGRGSEPNDADDLDFLDPVRQPNGQQNNPENGPEDNARAEHDNDERQDPGRGTPWMGRAGVCIARVIATLWLFARIVAALGITCTAMATIPAATVLIPLISGRAIFRYGGLPLDDDLPPLVAGAITAAVISCGVSTVLKMGLIAGQGRRALMLYRAMVLGAKWAIIGTLLGGVLPCLTGLFVHDALWRPLLSAEETVALTWGKIWAIGLVSVKLWARCVLAGPWLNEVWRGRLRRVLANGIRGVEFRFTMTEVCLPLLDKVGQHYFWPVLINRFCLPIAVQNQRDVLILQKATPCAFVLCKMMYSAMMYGAKRLQALHDMIRDDEYLVGVELENMPFQEES